jgi:hypothetical protein
MRDKTMRDKTMRDKTMRDKTMRDKTMTARRIGPKVTARRSVTWGGAVVVLSGAIVLAANAPSPAAPVPPVGATLASAPSGSTFAVNGFDINSGDNDLVPAPGTKPGAVSEGDQSIVNEQLTRTKETGTGKNAGYPIIGYVSGACTFTRVQPDGQSKGSPFDRVLENCIATAVLPKGSLTIQGVITLKAGVEQPATFGVTSGTGSYDGARGIVEATFGKQFVTYKVVLGQN